MAWQCRSSPPDRARTAASSPRNDLVHPKHWLISTQAASCGGTTGRRRSRTSATRCGPCSTRPRRRCPSGTSVFGVVFVFDLWRGVDGATRREARRRRWRRHGAVAPSPRSRPRGDAIDATHPSLFTGPERAPAPRLDIARGRRGQPGRRLRDQHHALDGLDGPDGPDHDAAREVSRMFVLASSRGPWRGRRSPRVAVWYEHTRLHGGSVVGKGVRAPCARARSAARRRRRASGRRATRGPPTTASSSGPPRARGWR